MIDNFKKYINSHKHLHVIEFILFVSLILMIWYSYNDVSIWWDEAVYIGMGKYIATGGSLGFWEIFRPPLLPLIYSLLFLLHIPLILAGKVIVILSSLGSILLAYLIGEHIKRGTGIYASIFLLVTPVFFYYTKIGTTDITSSFFLLFAIYLYFKEKYFWVGIVSAIAFLLRFPQGLIFFSLGVITLCDTYNTDYILWIKKSLKIGFYIGLGFVLLIIPYFISNYFFYGDILKPLTLSIDVIKWSGLHYNFGFWFYVKELSKVAPFLSLSFLIPIIFYKKDFLTDTISRNKLRAIVIILFTFILYFFWQSHKELRYSIAFIPYLAILSGISFYFILKVSKIEKILLSIFIVVLVFIFFKSIPYFADRNSYAYAPLNSYMETLKGTYISTTPILVAGGDLRVLSLFESSSTFKEVFNGSYDKIDGILLKDCDIYCIERKTNEHCDNDLRIIYDIINNSKFKKTYESVVDQCTFSIYHK